MGKYDKIKQQLLEEKKRIEERLKDNDEFGHGLSLNQSTSELSQYDNHPADSGTELYEREKDLSLREHLREQLEDIKDAIQRIDNGTYGICEVTGKPIPMERLEAIPTARTVVEASPNDEAEWYDRPIEEKVIHDMEEEYYTGSDEAEYNEQNAYDIVASYNDNSMTFDDSSNIDSQDGMGYVEQVEAIASTDIYGYRGDDSVSFQRNIQYDQYMNGEDREDEYEE